MITFQQTLFCCRWWESAARKVIEWILRANNGRWPMTVRQWEIVAARFKITIMLVRDAPPFPPCYDPDTRTIWCPYIKDRVLLHTWICHEMSEAILRDADIEDPLLEVPKSREDRHITSVLVQDMVSYKFGLIPRPSWIEEEQDNDQDNEQGPLTEGRR